MVHSSTRYLAPERIGDLRVAADFIVEGMDHVYRSSGLGVPLIAHRYTDESGSPDVQDQFFPRELRIAATAVVRPGGGLESGDWRRCPAMIELLDPFQEQSVTIGARTAQLASDRTTPLAMQVARSQLAALEWTGLFDSNFERTGPRGRSVHAQALRAWQDPRGVRPRAGLEPEGLGANDQRAAEQSSIAAHYQFWLFMYPTGQPIPGSADRLRRSLIKVRESFDPSHSDTALDRMVLVGHSMGGLLSKMMVQDSEARALGCHDHRCTRPVQGLPAAPGNRSTTFSFSARCRS